LRQILLKAASSSTRFCLQLPVLPSIHSNNSARFCKSASLFTVKFSTLSL